MAKKDPFDFPFGANAKPKKARRKRSGKSCGSGRKGNAWRDYVRGR